MKWVISVWDKISNLGVSPDIAPLDERRVVLTNRVALFALVLLSPQLLLYIQAGSPLAVVVQLITILGITVSWFLNIRGLYLMAGMWLISIGAANVFIIGSSLGQGQSEELGLISIAMLAFLLISPKEKLALTLSVGLCLAAFLVMKLTDYQLLGGFIPVENVDATNLETQNYISTLLLCSIIAFYFSSLSLKAYSTLAKSKEVELKALFDQAYDALILVEPETLFIKAYNQAAVKLMELPDELGGKELHLSEVVDLPPMVTEQELRNGPELILRINHSDDSPRWGTLIASNTHWEDKGFLRIRISDITSHVEAKNALRVAKEKAEEIAEAKTGFLNTMSHEVRTPLNAIVGMTSILAEADLEGELKDSLSTIQSSSENLLHLVEDILDYSHLESGNASILQEEFDLSEFLRQILATSGPIAKEKNIELEINPSSKVPRRLATDKHKLSQVIRKLLQNAIKFTHNGKVALHLDFDQSSQHLKVEIQDTGIGIPEEKLAYLGIHFSQLDSSMRRRYGGTGLGLAISYKLVELLGGQIQVQSEVGKGSSFSFEIPIREYVMSEVKKQTPSCFNGENPGIGRVLVVEDNSVNQKIIIKMLEKVNLSADIACNGVEALERFEAQAYPLVFMDLQMPEMDGITATKHIRQMNLSPQPIIIALTANTSEEHRKASYEAGMNDFMTKPIKLDKLRATLAQWVGESIVEKNA